MRASPCQCLLKGRDIQLAFRYFFSSQILIHFCCVVFLIVRWLCKLFNFLVETNPDFPVRIPCLTLGDMISHSKQTILNEWKLPQIHRLFNLTVDFLSSWIQKILFIINLYPSKRYRTFKILQKNMFNGELMKIKNVFFQSKINL